MPEKHLSRLIVGLVHESLDLSEIEARYNRCLGQPPFNPALMTALLLHSYASGIYSSPRIAKACIEQADFMMIVAGAPPDFRTISDFRERHLQALKQLFVPVLKLCAAAGLAKLGHVAFDGTKIKANASKHKAMSYERKKREAELQAEVERWLAAAEVAEEEDARHGSKRVMLEACLRHDDLPEWIADKQKRLAKIREAKAALEAEAKAAAEGETRRRAEAEENARPKAARGTGRRQSRRVRSPTARRSATSPIRRAVSEEQGRFIQGYNAQAAVDGAPRWPKWSGAMRLRLRHPAIQAGGGLRPFAPGHSSPSCLPGEARAGTGAG